MSTLFLIGTIAVVVGAIALAADGALDFLPDSEWFSLTGLAAAVAIFCFTAGILEGLGLPLAIAAIPGVIAALAVLAGTSWLIYKLRNSTAGPDSSVHALVGAPGNVVTRIPAGATGEVDLRHGGERHRFNATCDEDVPAGAQITVIGIVSPTCVRVTQLR
ncbi:MAG TPA: NfeD family protein [Propionicimonas sp.]|nr:NfeD family protein [Propionicimonas sp.]